MVKGTANFRLPRRLAKMHGGGPQTLLCVLTRFVPGRDHSRSQNHVDGSAPRTGELGDGVRSHCLSMRNRNLTMVYILLFVCRKPVVAIGTRLLPNDGTSCCWEIGRALDYLLLSFDGLTEIGSKPVKR